MFIDPNTFLAILQAKRVELSAGSANWDEIRIENAPEDFDRIQQHLNREVAIRHLDRESRLLNSVQEAINRIEIGVFGICLHCEEEIPEKRLKAVPWASCCLSCQEKLDQRRAVGEFEGDGDILEPAA